MNFEIDFSPLPDYVLIKTEGEALVEGFENLLKTLVNSPKWEPGMRQLVDHTNLIFKDLPSPEMRTIVDVVKKYRRKLGTGPCAFVVNSSLGFGLIRMYQMLGGASIHSQLGIFYTIDEAIEWLKKRRLYEPPSLTRIP